MARPLRIEYKGAFYHILQRGIERKNIFTSDSDKQKFLSYFDCACNSYGAIVHAYILMNNHYHIILETPHGNLSKIMHYLDASYAAFYNTKYKRVGPLYQGRYKSILVEQDEYLHHLSRYIHLNPVRANITKDPQEYTWSSYSSFVSSATRPQPWLNINFILSMFDPKIAIAQRLYRKFVMKNIGNEKDVIAENTKKGFILGSEVFAQDIINRYIREENNPEVPVVKQLKHKEEVSLDDIKRLVEQKIEGDKRLRKRICLYLVRRYTQKTLNQIADFYGKITDAGVSQAARRIHIKRQEDKELDKLLKELEKQINAMGLLIVET
jgi:putative transposase